MIQTRVQPAPLHTPINAGGIVTTAWAMWFQFLSSWPRALFGTHAQRLATPATSVPAGSTFFESDRGATYIAYYDGTDQLWYYEAGTMPGTIDPDQKPADLGTEDEGFLFFATDYQHTYVWDGSAWAYAPGDGGSGFIQWDTAAPTAGAWQIADGSPVDRSLADGTIASFTVPDLIGKFLKGTAAYTGAPVAEVIPNITGSTGLAGAHDHTFSGSADAAAGTTGTPSATTNVQSGSGATVASPTHTHPFDPAAAAVSGTTDPEPDHLHDQGTLQLDGAGEPGHLELIPYFRR